MKSLYNGLLKWGVAETRINYKFFGPQCALKEGAEATGRRAVVSERTAELKVSFAKAGLTAKWNPSLESILDLAEAQGLRPPFSCRAGICHTCTSKLIEGEVEYVTEPLDMPDPDCALICVSKPKTDLVIEV